MNKIYTICLVSLLCMGCVSYKIPTPMGDATLKTFLKTVDMPKVTYTTSNFAITVEGYVSKGDTEMVTASAGAIGSIAGATAAKFAQSNTLK